MAKEKSKKSDKSARGNASQFFVAGELCRRELVALVTIGNTPNTDILCSNKAGTKFPLVRRLADQPGPFASEVFRLTGPIGPIVSQIPPLTGPAGPMDPHMGPYADPYMGLRNGNGKYR